MIAILQYTLERELSDFIVLYVYSLDWAQTLLQLTTKHELDGKH